jgi:hypothetical protein
MKVAFSIFQSMKRIQPLPVCAGFFICIQNSLDRPCVTMPSWSSPLKCKVSLLNTSGEGEKGRCLPWSKEEEVAYIFLIKQVPVVQTSCTKQKHFKCTHFWITGDEIGVPVYIKTMQSCSSTFDTYDSKGILVFNLKYEHVISFISLVKFIIKCKYHRNCS